MLCSWCHHLRFHILSPTPFLEGFHGAAGTIGLVALDTSPLPLNRLTVDLRCYISVQQGSKVERQSGSRLSPTQLHHHHGILLLLINHENIRNMPLHVLLVNSGGNSAPHINLTRVLNWPIVPQQREHTTPSVLLPLCVSVYVDNRSSKY